MQHFIHDHGYNVECFGFQSNDIKRTFYFELPEYSIIETHMMLALTLQGGKSIVSIKMGIATCHPEDQYEKAIGRTVSIANSKLVDFKIVTVMAYPNEHSAKLWLWAESEQLWICMGLKGNHKKVRVLGIDSSAE